jgi:hypothetical protein
LSNVGLGSSGFQQLLAGFKNIPSPTKHLEAGFVPREFNRVFSAKIRISRRYASNARVRGMCNLQAVIKASVQFAKKEKPFCWLSSKFFLKQNGRLPGYESRYEQIFVKTEHEPGI